MKIGICAKVTPDTDTRIKVQGDGIDPTGVKWVVSPYDLFGVEAIEIGDVMVTLWRKEADGFLFILICEFFCAL